ncbi:hypothetical protein [Streptomyces sp. NPDC019890]|uniref:hypothetical protein n=1 Tax=Streptomyces sp. NPDC019890 TaxID=3365064 RepID=UPI00384A4818
MAGPWDANINLLHFAEDKSEFIAPTLDIGKEFDVRAEIEIGEELRGFATAYQLVVNVQNLSTGVVASRTVPGSLTPTRAILRTPVVVDFPLLAARDRRRPHRPRGGRVRVRHRGVLTPPRLCPGHAPGRDDDCPRSLRPPKETMT